MIFGDRLTGFVQTITSKGPRDVLTLMTGQQQAHVKIVIEIVWPGFVKSAGHDLAFPEMAGLRRCVSPRQTMRGGLRHDGRNQLIRAPVPKHDRVAADPLRLRMFLKMLRYSRKCPRKINVIAVDEAENLSGRL